MVLCRYLSLMIFFTIFAFCFCTNDICLCQSPHKNCERSLSSTAEDKLQIEHFKSSEFLEDESNFETIDLAIESLANDNVMLSKSTLKMLNTFNYSIPSTGVFFDQGVCISHCHWFRIDFKNSQTKQDPSYCSKCERGFIQYPMNATFMGRCFLFPDDFGNSVTLVDMNVILKKCLAVGQCECVHGIRKLEKMTLFERIENGTAHGKQEKVNHDHHFIPLFAVQQQANGTL